jgi:hypothetical protein
VLPVRTRRHSLDTQTLVESYPHPLPSRQLVSLLWRGDDHAGASICWTVLTLITCRNAITTDGVTCVSSAVHLYLD